MDEADRSDARIQAAIQEGIDAARRQVGEKRYYQSCQWCGDPTEDGAKFCGKDCHKDWHKYEATMNRLNVRRR